MNVCFSGVKPSLSYQEAFIQVVLNGEDLENSRVLEYTRGRDVINIRGLIHYSDTGEPGYPMLQIGSPPKYGLRKGAPRESHQPEYMVKTQPYLDPESINTEEERVFLRGVFEKLPDSELKQFLLKVADMLFNRNRG